MSGRRCPLHLRWWGFATIPNAIQTEQLSGQICDLWTLIFPRVGAQTLCGLMEQLVHERPRKVLYVIAGLFVDVPEMA